VATPTPVGPTCSGCGNEAAVNWQRRPTKAEVDAVIAAEEDRRAAVRLLADPQLPEPDFGPLPTGDGMTRTVYACAIHAITLDAASLIHESTCTAPLTPNLPGCNCTPVARPEAEPEAASSVSLPDHWITGD
jgi:hypothetical protein